MDYKRIENIGQIANKGKVEVVSITRGLAQDCRQDEGFHNSYLGKSKEILEIINNATASSIGSIADEFKKIENDDDIDISKFVGSSCGNRYFVQVASKEDSEPSEGEKAILALSNALLDDSVEYYFFDEIERGLGHIHIVDDLIPRLRTLKTRGKKIIISTHNANIALEIDPMHYVLCRYPEYPSIYIGDIYSDSMRPIDGNNSDRITWSGPALEHLEGSKGKLMKRITYYGLRSVY